jgi:diaminohydroxyphosphoribosylaminopyrimidine deaminase/5-amino-6-(5-phosphoribosylamino)uracil reductase
LDLDKLLRNLAKAGIANILVEGGGELAASLIEKNLVDRLLIFIAPKVIGGRDAITSVEGSGVMKVNDARRFCVRGVKRFGEDVLIEAEK